MKEIFLQPMAAMFSAARLLLKSRRALAVILIAYAGLLTAVYLFVSTREATIGQLVLTMVVGVIAPALFFVLQAASVSYTNGPLSKSLIMNCLKVIAVTVPVTALTVLAVYGLSKVESHPTLTTAFRYLLVAVFGPLLAIQLWVAASAESLRRLLKNLRTVAMRTVAPQSVFVYACGFLIFAVAPYFLITKTISSERAWLEFSFLMLRLSASALLVLLGWVTTVGALSILSHNRNEE